MDATLLLLVFDINVWTAKVIHTFSSLLPYTLNNFSAAYDLCSLCMAAGCAEIHDPSHEFFQIHEPGRVIVHTVVSENAAFNRPGHAPESQLRPNPSPTVHTASCDLCDSRIIGDRYVSPHYSKFNVGS